MKFLPLILLLALPTCQAAWTQRVLEWMEGIREGWRQMQQGERYVPLITSEDEALEYVDVRLREMRTRFVLRMHHGVSNAFVRKVADICMYRGYSNDVSFTIRGEELEIIPTYTDWAVMRAVSRGQLRESALEEDERAAYALAQRIVAEERARLDVATDTETQQYALALALHDRVCRHATYSLRDREPATKATARMLLTGRGVCEGYARSYALLLTMAGIDNQYIFGKHRGVGHSWNLVRLRGHWRHVDVTLDDAPKPTRRYFGLTDSQISTGREWERRWWPEAR